VAAASDVVLDNGSIVTYWVSLVIMSIFVMANVTAALMTSA